MDENKFKKEYLNSFPDTLVSWLDGFCSELDADKPRPPTGNDRYYTLEEYYKRLGAWETQQEIRKKILYAIEVEKRKTEESKKWLLIWSSSDLKQEMFELYKAFPQYGFILESFGKIAGSYAIFLKERPTEEEFFEMRRIIKNYK